MGYRRWAPAVLAIPALLLAACGSSTSPSSASAGSASAMSTPSSMSSGMSSSSGMMSTATLIKVKTSIGPVLADAKGFTLYWYSKDTRMASSCTGGCATAWPPVTGKPMAGMGVRLTGKFGTITRAGGILQATYKGHPLYTYAGDTAPGQVKGNGLGGVWHALRVNAIDAVLPSSLMMGSASSSPSPKAKSTMGSGGSGGGY